MLPAKNKNILKFFKKISNFIFKIFTISSKNILDFFFLFYKIDGEKKNIPFSKPIALILKSIIANTSISSENYV